MKKFSFLAILMLGLHLGIQVQASEIRAVIESLNDNKTKVLISSSSISEIKKGDFLQLGEDCLLEVTQNKNTQAILNAELCKDKQLLKNGAVLLLKESEAQTSKVVPVPSKIRSSGLLSKGFRVEFIKSFSDGSLTLKDGSSSDRASGDLDHKFGIGFGYANIGLNEPGFIAHIIFNQFNETAESIRFEGNGTYGFSEYIYFQGGLNLNKFTKGPTKLDAGIGFQFGIGVQLNEQFGLNFSYVKINNAVSIDGVKAEFEAQGLELNLHATF